MKIVVHDGMVHVRPMNGETVEDCDPRQTIALLREYGHVVYRGFPSDEKIFCEFTEQFGFCSDLPAGHADAFHPYQPDAIWSMRGAAGCAAASEQLIDGVLLLAEMGARWSAAACGNGIRFDRLHSNDTCRRILRGHNRAAVERRLARLRGVQYKFQVDGSLLTSFVAPLVTRTPSGADTVGLTALRAVLQSEPGGLRLADGRPMPETLVDHLKEKVSLARRAVTAAAGDLTVLDNHRMLRGDGGQGLALRQCDNMLGSFPPRAASPLDAALKQLVQSGSEPLPASNPSCPRAQPVVSRP